MANFSSFNFKLNGAQHVKDNATSLALALNVVSTDTYAEANAKVIASIAMTGADVVLSANGSDLEVAINGKAIDPTGTGLATDDLVVLVRSATEVILCLDATDRIITNESGDTVTIPALQTFVRELSAV